MRDDSAADDAAHADHPTGPENPDGTSPRPDAAPGEPAEFDSGDAEDARQIQEFWEVARIRAGLMRTAVVTGMSSEATVPPPAWSFGDNPRLADELLDLVLNGDKRATTSYLLEYERDADPLPQQGDLAILLDGAGRPRALIRTTGVDVLPFGEVTADQAYAEGEGDRSLATWRRDHETVFRRSMEGPGIEFSDDLVVVFERFELLYPQSSDR